MKLENSPPLRSLKQNKKKLLAIGFLLILVAVLMFSASIRQEVFASSTAILYPVAPMTSIKLIQAPNALGELTQVTFSGLVLNPTIAPTEIHVNYSVEVNGVIALSDGCVIYHLTGLYYTPCSVTVPYYASANVLLLASYKDGQGHLVAGLIEDPLAEPAWSYK